MVKYIIHKIVLTCKEATYLMELKDSNNITFTQNLWLKVHLKICKLCKDYESKPRKTIDEMLQIEHSTLHEIFEGSSPNDMERIDHLKQKITNRLTSNSKE